MLWSPLEIWTPKNSTMANFRHPVSNSWIRPCYQLSPYLTTTVGPDKIILSFVVNVWDTAFPGTWYKDLHPLFDLIANTVPTNYTKFQGWV